MDCVQLQPAQTVMEVYWYLVWREVKGKEFQLQVVGQEEQKALVVDMEHQV